MTPRERSRRKQLLRLFRGRDQQPLAPLPRRTVADILRDRKRDEARTDTKRGGAARSARQAHALEVGGSNPPRAIPTKTAGVSPEEARRRPKSRATER